MLKLFFSSLFLIAAVCAQNNEVDMMVKILSQENEIGTEMYRFSYEQSDGQTRSEVGMLINKGTPEEEFVVMGMYSFVGTDNNTYVTMYRADKNGYRPKVTVKKDHLIKSLLG